MAHGRRHLGLLLFALVLLAAAGWPLGAAAAAVEVTVEAAWPLGLDTTPAEARARAWAEARRLAAEQGAGVEVNARTIYQNSLQLADYLRTASRGLLVAETALVDELRAEGGQLRWVVRLQARVQPVDAAARGSFAIATLELRRVGAEHAPQQPVFNVGDELQICMAPSERARLHLFGVSHTGEVTPLYPNLYCPGEDLEARAVFCFPSATERGKGVRLRVGPPEGLNRAVESVVAVAVKGQHDFGCAVGRATITDLMAELAALDPALWAYDVASYEVRK